MSWLVVVREADEEADVHRDEDGEALAVSLTVKGEYDTKDEAEENALSPWRSVVLVE